MNVSEGRALQGLAVLNILTCVRTCYFACRPFRLNAEEISFACLQDVRRARSMEDRQRGMCHRRPVKCVLAMSSISISTCAAQFPNPQHMDDKLFEIAGLFSSVHVAGISSGLGRHGHRMAQCRECVITTLAPLPMQIGMCSASKRVRACALHPHTIVVQTGSRGSKCRARSSSSTTTRRACAGPR